MRVVLLSMVLILGGCLATQPPHNPLKKKEKEAPVVSAKVAVKPKAKPKPEPELAPELPLNKVELMKEMFLVQQDLKAQVLKLAEDLSDEELAELNRFLTDYGVTIHRKLVPKPSPDRRAF